ncbi:MAG: TIGR00282 family metallophosphoesterase [Synergistaceae bacterium]|jgi:metallophosphoesterase (TIGR00282 family)|nr:TIGR00282 family metallophosphoesterase [Synergistaceae bacterium]
MRILFVGDIMGRPGRSVLAKILPSLSSQWKGFDFVVINCENAAAGKGMTEKVMEELFAAGVQGMTSGNHIWDKNIFYPALASETRIVRPANYPPGCPGTGYTILEHNGKRLGLLNLQGRVFMPPLDCPFRAADAALHELEKCASTGIPILVDFHAEATSEKKALGIYLDGRVSALVGTHTHVQTADDQILSRGTAYISDVGMTGGHGGIIGIETENVMSRYLTGLPSKFEVCSSELKINAVVIDIDDDFHRAVNLTRINEYVDLSEAGPAPRNR